MNHDDLMIHDDFSPDPQALAFFRALDLPGQDLKTMRQLADGLRLWRACGRARCVKAQACARRDVICAGERFFMLQRLVFEPLRRSMAREEGRQRGKAARSPVGGAS